MFLKFGKNTIDAKILHFCLLLCFASTNSKKFNREKKLYSFIFSIASHTARLPNLYASMTGIYKLKTMYIINFVQDTAFWFEVKFVFCTSTNIGHNFNYYILSLPRAYICLYKKKIQET